MTRSSVVAGRSFRAVAIVVALCAATMLAACAPRTDGDLQLAMAGPPNPGMLAGRGPFFADGSFATADGRLLPLRKWLPPSGGVHAVILALHGFNDYGNAFDAPAKIWAQQGIATYAYDQRGFGAAPGHGRWAGTPTLAADAVAASRILRRLYSGVPVYLLGESMGGAIAIVAASGTADTPPAPVDGVILSAPAVWGRATMDVLPRLALWTAIRLFPSMTLTGSELKIKPTDNIPMLRALSRDPLVIKSTRVDAIYGLVDLMDAALEAAPRLRDRLLLLYGAHDELVPRTPIRLFVAHLPAEGTDPEHSSRRFAFYPQGYHMLLRDLEGAQVAGDVASWVLHPQMPLPSGADRPETEPSWPPHHQEGEAD